MTKKFYYLIESLDINGDKNSDGFLITKYKINKKNNDKIFLVSKYVTFKNFKKKYNKLLKTVKGGNIPYQQQFPPNYYNKHEYNNYMNDPYYNKQQHPHVMVAYQQPSMGNAFIEGLGGGIGAGLGFGLMDGIFNSF